MKETKKQLDKVCFFVAQLLNKNLIKAEQIDLASTWFRNNKGYACPLDTNIINFTRWLDQETLAVKP